MKKFLMVLGLVIIIAVPTEIMAESPLMRAWKQWVIMRNAVSGVDMDKKETKSPVIIERDTLGDEAMDKLKWSGDRRRYSSRNYYPVNKVKQATTSTKLRAQVSALRPLNTIYEITSDPVKVFEVGVRLQERGRSTDYKEAVLLDRARFKLFQNSGIAEDLDNVQLLINDEAFDLDDDGSVEVKFHNARVAVGESISFDVSLRIEDPSITPHVNGNLFLRMESLSARGERSGVSLKSFMYGDLVSKKLVFAPTPVVNSGKSSEVVLREHKNVYGRMLGEGEEALVLIGQFSANYDDLYVRGATLRNTLTGSNVDPLIDEVVAIDLKTGKVLDRSRFINGAVRFDFSPDVFVGRGDSVRVGFQVEVDDRLSSLAQDPRFKLKLDPDDLIVQSATTGRNLASGAKNFTIESEEFSISQSKMVIYPSGQQESFAVGTYSPETVFRFVVSGGELALGRVSFDVFPSGLEFQDSSLTSDDVDLVRIVGGREREMDVDVSVLGNRVTVDFTNELIKYRGEDMELGLQVALADLPGNSDSDSVAVRILGDSTLAQGTLSTVRSSSTNFIWSDMSSNRHGVGSADWSSGYLVNGLPSNTAVVKRFK